MPINANARAALFMMLGMTAFVLNDAITKWLTTDIGVGQTMLYRGIVACLLLAALAHWQGVLRNWRKILHPTVMIRSLLEVLGSVTFLFALPIIPFSNISAIYQALPLAVTLGAALFLAEPVGWRRWIAILIGFGGVMLIVLPGMDGFTVYSVVVIISVFFSAARDLVTRKMPTDVPTFLIAFLASVGVSITGAALIPFQGGLVQVTFVEVAGIMVAAILLLIAYSALITAMRAGEVSFVAPFRYVALVVALILGYFAFNEIPDQKMLIGASIIVVSGIYMFHRERVRAAEKANIK